MTAPAEQDQGAPRQGVRVTGLRSKSVLGRWFGGRSHPGRVDFDQLPVVALLRTDSMGIEHFGDSHVPELVIRGKLAGVFPFEPEKLPYGINQIGVPEGERPELDAVYRFTSDQLSTLVDKGLYVPGFSVPGDWLGVDLEIPMVMDTSVIPPVRAGEPPLVLVDFDVARLLDLNSQTCPYDFAASWPDHRSAMIEAGLARPDDVLGIDRSEELVDQFGDDDLLLGGPTEPRPSPAAPVTDLASLAARMEALTGTPLRGAERVAALRAEMGAPTRSRVELGSKEDRDVARMWNERIAGRLADEQNQGPVADQTPTGGVDDADLEGLELSDDDVLDFDFGDDSPEPGPSETEAHDEEAHDASAALELSGQDGFTEAELDDPDLDDSLAERPGDDDAERARKAARRLALRRARAARAARAEQARRAAQATASSSPVAALTDAQNEVRTDPLEQPDHGPSL